MILIEKIEIKYFRSFSDKVVKIIELKDLNVFSGSNDVGKSNILRALNLFFNDEISINEKFNLEKDLSFTQKNRSLTKLVKKKELRGEDDPYVAQRDLFVKVKLFFFRSIAYDKSTTPERFWVEKKWDKNGLNKSALNTNIITAYKQRNSRIPTAKQKAALLGQLTRFLNSIYFEYIPAVKDRKFINYLFKKLQSSLFERDKTFKKTSDDINKKITGTTLDLFKEFQEKTGVNAKFSIPQSLIDFFTTINVTTENGVSLYSRGDGIQARFIPAILNEIAKGKKYVIWGFEEPENSYEYRNAELLANDFINTYSKDKQIFITSHTKEFLSMIKDNEENVSLHRVYKTINSGTLVEAYKPNRGFNKKAIMENFWKGIDDNQKDPQKTSVLNKIFEDIGFLESDQFLIDDLQNQLKIQRDLLDSTNLGIMDKDRIIRQLTINIQMQLLTKEQLVKEINELQKPIVFFEDDYIQIYKIAFLKLNDIEFDKDSLDARFIDNSPYIFYSKNCVNELRKSLDAVNIFEWNGKKIIGLFDFDSAYSSFNGLRAPRWSQIRGESNTGYFKHRIDNNKVYSMLLPVPSERHLYASLETKDKSALEIELYFSDLVLDTLGNLGEESLPGVSEKRKIFIGSKADFWEKLIDLDKEAFQNFSLLFNKFNELFQM